MNFHVYMLYTNDIVLIYKSQVEIKYTLVMEREFKVMDFDQVELKIKYMKYNFSE